MKTLSWMLPSIFLIGALTGCGKSTPEPISPTAANAASSSDIHIAVIPKGTTHEFWQAVEAGAQEAATELGIKITWKGPLKEDNRDEQIKVVEDFINAKVSGIVLAPLDDSALRPVVTQAQDAGIPVLIIDSALKEVSTVSFVATDNFAAGKSGGTELSSLLGSGKKKVVVLRYIEGSASTTERENGAIEALKSNPSIEILSDNQYAGATVETAQTAAENLINRFKNADGTVQFDGVFCPNESSTFGMLRALQDAGLAGKVKFVGFDASTKLVEALEADQIHGLMVQNPHKMGYLGVKSLHAKLKGETVQSRIDTGAEFVTKAKLSDPAISKLVKPKSS